MNKDYTKNPPILCVDFDGVLHSYKSGWGGARSIPDPPMKGALKWLYEIIKSNKFKVCIYSSRSRYFLGRYFMKRWLFKQYFNSLNKLDATKTKYTDWQWQLVCEEPSMDPWEIVIKYSIKKILKKLSFPTKKPPAFLMIDDRAFCFNGIFPSADQLTCFKPYREK